MFEKRETCQCFAAHLHSLALFPSKPPPGLGSLLKSALQLVDRLTTSSITLCNPKAGGEREKYGCRPPCGSCFAWVRSWVMYGHPGETGPRGRKASMAVHHLAGVCATQRGKVQPLNLSLSTRTESLMAAYIIRF